MFTLKDIKTDKQVTADESSSIKEVLGILNENRSGCIVILQNEKAIGIITESDIIAALNNNIPVDEKALRIAGKKLVQTDENRPIEFAFEILNQYNIKRLLLKDENNLYKGIVLQEDMIKHLESDFYKVDLKIKNLIDIGKKLFYVDDTTTLRDTLTLMQKHKIGSVLITKNNRYIGIVTEKDIIQAIYNDVDLLSPISLYMTSPLITIPLDTDVHTAIEMMQLQQIRRIPITDSKQEVIALLTNRDILRHIKGNYTKVLQNKIKHAQEIMNFLLEPIIEVYLSGNNAIISWLNDEAIKHFGDCHIDTEITRILHQKDWDTLKNHIESYGIISNITVKIQDLTYEVSGIISKNISSSYIKLILKDVSSYENKNKQLQKLIDKEIKKRMESEYLLMQQAKLATMGEMIGHIAHQWRQPLSIITTLATGMKMEKEFHTLDDEKFLKNCDLINDNAQYLSETINTFRGFIRDENEQKEIVLQQRLDEILKILEASLTNNYITIYNETKNTKDIRVTLVANELDQVIINIINNSKDAIIGNNIQNGWVKLQIKRENNHALITVEDNGGGIPKKILPNIFDPYFTTKHKSQGTGLGLHMSYRIVTESFKGRLYAKNSQNGAKFFIELPLIN